MADLPTLRKHEAVLERDRAGCAALIDLVRDVSQTITNQATETIDALDYALSHLREEIAKAEAAEARIAAQCPRCLGSGEQVSWSSLRDYDRCRACHGTGKRPTEAT